MALLIRLPPLKFALNDAITKILCLHNETGFFDDILKEAEARGVDIVAEAKKEEEDDWAKFEAYTNALDEEGEGEGEGSEGSDEEREREQEEYRQRVVLLKGGGSNKRKLSDGDDAGGGDEDDGDKVDVKSIMISKKKRKKTAIEAAEIDFLDGSNDWRSKS
jgi:hypothetical protein